MIAAHWRRRAAALLCAGLLAGCAAHAARAPRAVAPFSFARDTFAYANELEWTYGPNGTHTVNADRPLDYSHRCFVMTSAARQFHLHARFAPEQPALAAAADYQPLVQEVYRRSPRELEADSDPVVIPGYADLRAFSTAYGQLLRDESGSGFGSYFERGNWRLVFPFTRDHQERTAGSLLGEIHAGEQPIVHLVRFPVITINHAVMLYGAVATGSEIAFTVYDPNHPEKPMELLYDRATHTFNFAANNYFEGGRVDVYEIFRGALF
ncbi:MAG TPA: hypothetical protein VHE37_12910 [Nevskiaceae bacterium]|nr:hypothetical protein [Nevskiaceae bacterium]